MKFKFQNLFSVRWWACAFRYTRGVVRYAHGKYEDSINDFQWILKDGSFAPVSCLVYENLGVNYARLKDFTKAAEYLNEPPRSKLRGI